MKKVRRIESAFELARILLALVIAYALSLLCLVLVTEDPIEAVYMFAVGPLTSTRRIGQVIVKFIPYALCGVGMCFMYASNRFSMFGEGSYLMSGCFVTIAAFALEPYHLPLIVMVPILLVVGSLRTMPLPFTKTRTDAVPRSIPISFAMDFSTSSYVSIFIINGFSACNHIKKHYTGRKCRLQPYSLTEL